jgi:hypothetical protein
MTITAQALTKALRTKGAGLPITVTEDGSIFRSTRDVMDIWSSTEIADAITTHELHLSIMPGVRPAITFEAYFQALFGQKLDGSPVRRKRA